MTAYVLDALSPELQAKTSESLQEQINIMQARGVEQTFKPNDIYFDPKMTWSMSGVPKRLDL